MDNILKILIVDDDENQSLLLKKYFELKNSGCSVSITRDYESTILILKEENFDGIILDLRLPEKKGGESLSGTGERIFEDMNSMGITRDTSVVILTGYATVDRAAYLTKRGACESIQKPTAVENIVNILLLSIDIKKLKSCIKDQTIASIRAATEDVILHNINNDLNDRWFTSHVFSGDGRTTYRMRNLVRCYS